MKARKLIGIALIFLFVATTALVDFFHTERSPKPSSSCPACRLQASSLAILKIDSTPCPQLRFLEYLIVFERFDYARLVSPDLATRSPPLG